MKEKKNFNPFKMFAFIVIAIIAVIFIKNYNEPHKVVEEPVVYSFDTSTEIGALQQEIYDEYGIAVLYDRDVIAEKELGDELYSYERDYHISDPELIPEKLNIIKDCLSIYTKEALNNLTPEIYLVNGFRYEGSGASVVAYINDVPVTIILNLDFIDEHLVFHETAHVLKTNEKDIDYSEFESIPADYCSMVSGYSCQNEKELFAEVVSYTITANKTYKYTLALSDFFESNIKYFETAEYINYSNMSDYINKLFNNEIDSFILNKDDEVDLNQVIEDYPDIVRFHRIETADSILFYN